MSTIMSSFRVGINLRRMGFLLTVTLSLYFIIDMITAMKIQRPWTTKPWCESVKNPNWPFAYEKCLGCDLERKGRTNSNLQDMRHSCTALGVNSKCTRCKDLMCTGGNYCGAQIQGIDYSELPVNVPTVSDTPWAVGGSHRNDFGNASAICVLLSGGDCISPFNTDYSNCTTRCWGYDSGSLTQVETPLKSELTLSDNLASDYWEYNKRNNTYQGEVSTFAGAAINGYLVS